MEALIAAFWKWLEPPAPRTGLLAGWTIAHFELHDELMQLGMSFEDAWRVVSNVG